MTTNKIFFKEGYKYVLAAQYGDVIPLRPASDIKTDYVTLLKNGYLAIRKGFAWDGPSGPAIDTPSALRGSMIHDAGYQILRAGLMPQSSRKDWDALYEKCCIEDGMSKIRAWVHFKALRAFGWRAADPSSENPILTAP